MQKPKTAAGANVAVTLIALHSGKGATLTAAIMSNP